MWAARISQAADMVKRDPGSGSTAPLLRARTHAFPKNLNLNWQKCRKVCETSTTIPVAGFAPNHRRYAIELFTQLIVTQMTISILGNQVQSPLRCAIQLRFPDEDLARYSWLKQRDRYYSLEKQLDPGGFSIPVLGYPCDEQGARILDAPPIVVKFPNLAAADRFTMANVIPVHGIFATKASMNGIMFADVCLIVDTPIR